MLICALGCLIVSLNVQVHGLGLGLSENVPKVAQIRKVPMPPQPYSYDGFMQWFNRTNFSMVAPGFKVQPERKEYDIDAARRGKFEHWLQGPDGDAAVTAAKRVNRYLFSADILQNGDFTTMANPHMHLYILSQLRPAALSAPPILYDAGCGTGFLLAAWRQMVGGLAVGVESNAETAAAAQSFLENPEAWGPGKRGPTPRVVLGDALRPDASLGLALVDAVNVGFAVGSVEELAPLSQRLRTGGRLTAPVCTTPDKQKKDVPAGFCDALFEVFERDSDGVLHRLPDRPGIPVRFVRPAAKRVSLRGSKKG